MTKNLDWRGWLLTAACMFGVSNARADGYPQQESSARENWTASENSAANQGAGGDMDPRLPPVLPGETIVRNGRTMKMWSTSGPVPVSPPAVAPAGEVALPKGLSVIVDQRKPAAAASPQASTNP